MPSMPINLFAVVCLGSWPLNESEAGVDLVLIETSLLFLCKFDLDTICISSAFSFSTNAVTYSDPLSLKMGLMGFKKFDDRIKQQVNF